MNALKKAWYAVFGRKVHGTRVRPMTTKILLVFTVFLLISNLASNYINLVLNRKELVSMMKQLLIKDLKEIYDFANTQNEIYKFNDDLDGSKENIEKKSALAFKHKKSIALGVKPDGSLFFEATSFPRKAVFSDKKALDTFIKNKSSGTQDGFLPIVFNGNEYFAIYKYNPKWDIFIVRGEEINEFYSESRKIFQNISIIIIMMTLLFSVVGIVILQYIMRFINTITESIILMTQSAQMNTINMDGATNDDVTFLGIAFNSLSSTVNNLMSIFRKFVNKDIALKAYREREVRLEGTQRELTILFSDIKRFTFMTETLGTDIIKLLNLHYDRAIREIIKQDGVIGSIIGDALLAVFGALDDLEYHENKSYQSILAAYQIQSVAESLRAQMQKRRDEIVDERGSLTADEERVYQAVLLEVGVGIDGGNVFYGNIGSHERMTNTVIGDNVNSASRLEGLTRMYKVPVICSDFIKDDVEKKRRNHNIYFLEIDTVQVKGKTEGKKVFWPIPEGNITSVMKKSFKIFSAALELYYAGDWKKALKYFKDCDLPLSEIFIERLSSNKIPKDWNGIWTMTTK